MHLPLYRFALATTLTCCPIAAMADDTADTDQGLLATGLLQGWQRELDIGINGSNGNSETLSVHAGFKAGYRDSNDVWKFITAYDTASDDGNTSRNQFFADLQKDWLWADSPWFTFAQGRYDWDELKDWNSRIALAAGLGYQFVKNNTWDIAGRAGLGGSRTYGGTDDQFVPEAVLGLDVGWTISERESVLFATTFYPSLEGGGEFRNISTMDWKMHMGDSKRLAMKIGLANEYDSQAAEGTEQNDFKYYLALVWAL